MISCNEAPVWRTLFYLRWRRAVLAAIWCVVACLAATAGASTYYIDFAGGSDANDGLSTSTPFKTIPGTVKADASDYLNLLWGSISAQARVPDNTTFIIKAGTTETFAAGGYVWLAANTGDFYKLGYTNLVFEVATNWGTGSTATIDATGMVVPIAAFLIQIDGVTVSGLTIENCTAEGLQVKEKAGSDSAVTNTLLFNDSFFNNVTITTDDLSGSGYSQIDVRKAIGLVVSNCVINGNNNWSEGILLGDSGKHVTAALIESCTASNLQGDIPNNDSGIGFKALNSIATWSNCVSVGNLKGFDLGEENGNGSNITYKVISCTASNNYWGINFNAVGTIPYVGLPIKFYAINNLSVSNALSGIHCYAGPYSLFVVNNVLDNNGAAGGTYDGINLSVSPDSYLDTNLITAYIYNNIFQRAFDYQLETSYDSSTNNQTWNCDYNSYQQQASEHFALWSLSFGPSQATFDYGTDGPGHASGNWYSWCAKSTTKNSRGTGHLHNDANSTGTGCSNTNLPSLNADYTLQSSFPGSKLATNSWYIPEMGIDRYGQPRKHWDIGMYEYVTMQPPTFLHASSPSISP